MKSTTCFTFKAVPSFLFTDGLRTFALCCIPAPFSTAELFKPGLGAACASSPSPGRSTITQKSNKPTHSPLLWLTWKNEWSAPHCHSSPWPERCKHPLQVVLSPQTPQGPFFLYLSFHWFILASWLHNKAPSYPQVILEGQFWIERTGWQGN